MHYHARDMAVVRARDRQHPDRARRRRRRRSRPRSMRGAAATRACICRSASAASTCRAIEAIDLRTRRPAARPLHRAAARRGGEDRARARRAGAAVPQPPRLCAADALPRLRLSASPARTATPGWSITASSGGWSATIAASRCRRRRSARNARRRTRFVAGRPRRRAAGGGGGGAVSRTRASWCCPATWSNRSSGCARSSTTSPQGRFDIIIGTQLVAKGHHFPKLNLVGVVDADLGLAQRRSARGRAHVPAAASGGRPRRPRGRAAASAICRRISPSIR